jgi:hypothetical protein
MPAPVITTQMYRTQKITIFAAPSLKTLEAPLASNPVWSVDVPLLVTLRPSTDGLSCDVVANGPTGVVNVTMTATGQTLITQVVQITIVTDYADTITLTTSSPIPQ